MKIIIALSAFSMTPPEREKLVWYFHSFRWNSLSFIIAANILKRKAAAAAAMFFSPPEEPEAERDPFQRLPELQPISCQLLLRP